MAYESQRDKEEAKAFADIDREQEAKESSDRVWAEWQKQTGKTPEEVQAQRELFEKQQEIYRKSIDQDSATSQPQIPIESSISTNPTSLIESSDIDATGVIPLDEPSLIGL